MNINKSTDREFISNFLIIVLLCKCNLWLLAKVQRWLQKHSRKHITLINQPLLLFASYSRL